MSSSVQLEKQNETMSLTVETEPTSITSKVSQCCLDLLDKCSVRKCVNKTALVSGVLLGAATISLIIAGAVKGEDEEGRALIGISFLTMFAAGCCLVPCYLGTKKHGNSYEGSSYGSIETGGAAAAF